MLEHGCIYYLPPLAGELSYPKSNIPIIVTKADKNHLHIIIGLVTSLK